MPPREVLRCQLTLTVFLARPLLFEGAIAAQSLGCHSSVTWLRVKHRFPEPQILITHLKEIVAFQLV